MSTFKDDIGFWGTKRRTSRKRRHNRSTTTGRYEQSSRSKKEVQAFERGIIVGMKTSFERGTGRYEQSSRPTTGRYEQSSRPTTGRSKKEVQHAFERGMRCSNPGQRDAGMKTSFERRRRFSMPNGQPMTLGDLRRRSPSEYRSLMRGPTHMAHSPQAMHRFSAFGHAKRRSIRRSRMRARSAGAKLLMGSNYGHLGGIPKNCSREYKCTQMYVRSRASIDARKRRGLHHTMSAYSKPTK